MSYSAPVTISAYGVSLKKGATPIAQVTKIDGVGVANPPRETTHLLSVFRSKRPTIPETNEVEFELLMTNTNVAALEADAVAGTISTWSVTYPNDDASAAVTDSPEFKAYPSKVVRGGMEPDGTCMATVTLTATDDYTS